MKHLDLQISSFLVNLVYSWKAWKSLCRLLYHYFTSNSYIGEIIKILHYNFFTPVKSLQMKLQWKFHINYRLDFSRRFMRILDYSNQSCRSFSESPFSFYGLKSIAFRAYMIFEFNKNLKLRFRALPSLSTPCSCENFYVMSFELLFHSRSYT